VNLLYDLWPASFKKYYKLYWYVSLTFVLPFSFAFLVLSNDFATGWLINLTLSLLVLSTLVDWVKFLKITIAGILSGYIFYWFLNPQKILYLKYGPHFWFLYTVFWSTLICLLFSRQRDINIQNKLSFARSIAGSIAHEVKHPLTIISGYLKYYKDNNEPNEIIEKIEKKLEDTIVIIQHILTNLGMGVNHKNPDKVYMQECIKLVIDTYPMREDEKRLIKLELNDDFLIFANKIAIYHVLFNLLKNALYYIKLKHNSVVTIKTEVTKSRNLLIIEDNSIGIHNDDIEKIFKSFYSTTPEGTGLGLFYCKQIMESLGGSIVCDSKLGYYTRFILTFPKID
jgi:signal transduction histidine kinase